MRLGLRLLLALMSCCSLMYINGCGPESQDELVVDNTNSVDSASHAGDKANPALKPTEQAPLSPPGTVPARPAVIPPVGGGGGGSQGAEEHADTGNPDHDPRHLPETICNDGIDNDGNGKIDCADTTCNGNSCNDGNGCTLNDTCTELGVCSGSTLNCNTIIGNECTMNSCESVSSDAGDDNFKCNSMLKPASDSFGSCTPDDNCAVDRNPDGTCPRPTEACFIGRCVESRLRNGNPPAFVCEGADRATLPTPDGGCFDGNPCHSFACEDGECDIDILDGVFCDDGNLCTGIGLCNLGVCEAEPLGGCETADDCEGGQPCIGGACGCSDGNDCTTGETCNGNGECSDGTNSPQTCTVNEDCESGVCDNNLCVCTDDNDCTGSDACSAGACTGTPVGNTCASDMECTNGGNCVGAVPGTCTGIGPTPCFDDTPCLGGFCLGATLGTCSCDDGIACTVNSCSNGSCTVTAEDDETCTTDENPCTTQTCELTGCKTTVMDGAMTCDLILSSLSEALDTIIEDAGLSGLTCTFGRLTCEDGSASDCSPSEAFLATCSEATLESSCTVGNVTEDISPEVATAICNELNALTEQ